MGTVNVIGACREVPRSRSDSDRPRSSPIMDWQTGRTSSSKITLLLCGAVLVSLFVSFIRPAVGETAAQQTHGVKRALLIGINRYKSVPALKGSVNDVETMREILTSRWGFLPRNITVLTDENATRDNMLAALNRLVQEANPADTVYFHYAGHGSQVVDFSGDESDGLDETIVPQDGRNSGVRDIVDDELDVIFSRLRARNAVIVLDSCHSGTATRSLDFVTRSLPRDARVELYRTSAIGTVTRGIVPFERSHFVVMSGAAANEAALDGPIDGRFHGFFTYALSRALMAAGSDVSPREVFSGVTRELARIQAIYGPISMPEPQLEAPPTALDQPLFVPTIASSGGQVPVDLPRLAWLEVTPAPDGQVTLVNGILLGAAPGSTWAIYPDGETRFYAGHAIATVVVTQLTGKDALASLVQPRRPITSRSRAVALMPAPSLLRPSIRFLNVPEDQRSRIEGIFGIDRKDLTVVGPKEEARFLVDMEGQTVRLLTADGLQSVGTFDVSDERSAADVQRMVSRAMKVAQLLTLDNPSSQIVVSARVTGSHPVTTRDIGLVADAGPADMHTLRPGEVRSSQNSLQLSITVNVDAYLTIVDVDSEGTISVGFPNDEQHREFYPDGAVPANQDILIPDSLLPNNRAGYYWDYNPPRGVDTIRIFASTDLATAKLIRMRIRALQSDGNDLESRGSQVGLEYLRTDLTALATRDEAIAGRNEKGLPVAADWAATTLTIRVESP